MFMAHAVLFSMARGGGGISPGVEWPRQDAANLSPSRTTIKHKWSYISKLPYAFMECIGMTLPCAALPVVIQMFMQMQVCNLCSYQTTPKYNAQLVEALCYKPVHVRFFTGLILPAALKLWDLLSL